MVYFSGGGGTKRAVPSWTGPVVKQGARRPCRALLKSSISNIISLCSNQPTTLSFPRLAGPRVSATAEAANGDC
jgi:hypothetical protein